MRLRKPSEVEKDKKASMGFAVGSFGFLTWAVFNFFLTPENQGRYTSVAIMGAFGVAWGYASHCLWPYGGGD
jgi:hypothetical protein